MTRPLQEAADLGDTLVRRPREFPGRVTELFRRGFRRVWQTRGGGLYACGFFVTFVILEVRMLFGDVTEASGVGDFLAGQLIEFVMRFTVESLQNTIHAFLWPLHLMGFRPPWGLVALGVMYVLFPLTLKGPLERWLIDDQPAAPNPEDKT